MQMQTKWTVEMVEFTSPWGKGLFTGRDLFLGSSDALVNGYRAGALTWLSASEIVPTAFYCPEGQDGMVRLSPCSTEAEARAALLSYLAEHSQKFTG